MKAIETKYKGYRFRSRLEARWAVFFDTLNVDYEYEPEGFQFDNTFYLPDFWLPHLSLWIEIKGKLTWVERQWESGYTYEISPELELTKKFKDAQEWPVILIDGTPGKEKIHFYGWDIAESSAGSYNNVSSEWVFSNGILTLKIDGSSNRTFYSDDLTGGPMPQFNYSDQYGYSYQEITSAYKAARSARFEFGESG